MARTANATTPALSASNGGPAEPSARDPELLLRIYRAMVLTRAVEDRMVAMYTPPSAARPNNTSAITMPCLSCQGPARGRPG